MIDKNICRKKYTYLEFSACVLYKKKKKKIICSIENVYLHYFLKIYIQHILLYFHQKENAIY